MHDLRSYHDDVSTQLARTCPGNGNDNNDDDDLGLGPRPSDRPRRAILEGGARAVLQRRTRVAYGILLACAFGIACGTTPSTPSNVPVYSEAELRMQSTASVIYLAYADSECATVLAQTEPGMIDDWPSGELRASTELLRGFCLENDGRRDDAMRAYRMLTASVPKSFAAQDARERLRTLKREEEDPDFANRAEQIAREVDPARPGRTPVERAQAAFPPVAQLAGVDGWAVIGFGVDESGQTVDPVVADSNPPLLFEGTALRAVRGWTFTRQPGSKGSDKQIIRIVFKTEDGVSDSSSK